MERDDVDRRSRLRMLRPLRRSTDPNRQRFRRGAYVLPSLFTIGNMVLGFYAIVCGLGGQFLKAALLVFLAAILDLLDGKIARMTGTESDFGKEYDSLADVITFGATPCFSEISFSSTFNNSTMADEFCEVLLRSITGKVFGSRASPRLTTSGISRPHAERSKPFGIERSEASRSMEVGA